MAKTSAGSEIINEFLEGGYEKGSLTTIYGPAGTGKTLFCLIAAIEAAKDKKVIYIDTTKGFSTSRIKQLDDTPKTIFDKIFVLKPKSFYEQKIMIEGLKDNINEDIGLIIIDTLTYFYRLELAKDVNMINRVLTLQLNLLKDIAKRNKIPIIITNSVYDDLKKEEVNMPGGEILKRRSKYIIELKNYKTLRKAVIRKPVCNKELLFRIEEKGISSIRH